MTPPEGADYERIKLRQDWNGTRGVTAPGRHVTSASKKREEERREAKLTSPVVVSLAVSTGRMYTEGDEGLSCRLRAA